MLKANGQHPAAPDGHTEQRILDAAHAVFLRRGTAGARMQEIADEAGVNKALLHYYFRSKSRLADAVFGRVVGQLLPPVLEILGSDLEIEDKVRRVVALELEHLARNPYAPAYVVSELIQHPERVRQFIKTITGIDVGRVAPPVRDTLDRQLRARARAGTLRPIPAEQFVVNLLGLCLFPFIARPMISAALQMDEKRFAQFIEYRKKELAAFFLAALRP